MKNNILFLDRDELEEVIRNERAEDLFVGGVVDFKEEVLHLYRGNFEILKIPLGWFECRPKATPDFHAFAVADFGQTICFGSYEVSSDAILCEFDFRAQERIKNREKNIKTKKNSCNRHLDCEAANEKAKELGRLWAEHCHDDCCEECFGC